MNDELLNQTLFRDGGKPSDPYHSHLCLECGKDSTGCFLGANLCPEHWPQLTGAEIKKLALEMEEKIKMLVNFRG